MIEVFVESGPSGSGKFTLTEQALAARLELSVTDTRKRVTLLRNLLNVEGYAVLAQPDRDSLELDIELLRTQFALDGGEA
jgi:cytidylate kinase